MRAILGDPARERELTPARARARRPRLDPRAPRRRLRRRAGLGPEVRGLLRPGDRRLHLKRDDHERERCWIAELDGVRCGSIYCTRRTDEVAQVRLLLVEPWARGAGAGAALAEACVDFAREAGYEQIMLFTNSSLTSARRIYESIGFEFRAEQPEDIFEATTRSGQEFWLDL